jgi:hypothetical protein
MPDLKHPETGEHARASRATADALIKEGWEEINATAAAEETTAPKAPKAPKTPKTEGGSNSDTDLSKMKMPELLAHAEKVGLPAEQIDALRKPGTSKKTVIESITAAHTSS